MNQTSSHWLYQSRIRLLKKLGSMFLPYGSALVYCNNHEETRYFTDGWKLSIAENPANVDVLVLNDIEVSELDKYAKNCKPNGIIFVNQSIYDRHKGKEIINSLNDSGFDIRSIGNYGFFIRFFTFFIRDLGFQNNLDKPPIYPINKFFYLLMKVESLLHPYVSFPFGESSYIIALKRKNMEAPDFSLSIVIPAYNEEKRILPFLESIFKYFKTRKVKFEVLVIDDGSKDNTAAVVNRAFPKVKYTSLYRNFGKGGAVQEGILRARGERILITDADGATPIGELEKLEKWITKGRDIAIGSRYMSDSDIVLKQSIIRRIISRVGNLSIRILLGIPFKDTQCGFKLFQFMPAKLLFRNLKNMRFGFDFEILKYAQDFGFSAAEVPVRWEDKAGSKVSRLEVFNVLKELARIRFGYFYRFSLVGVLNTILYMFLNDILHIFNYANPILPAIYSSLAFLLTTVLSFFLNSSYTFKARGSYLKFLAVSIITLILSMLAFSGLNSSFNLYKDHNLSQLLRLGTFGIGFFTNYFGYKLLVFRVFR